MIRNQISEAAATSFLLLYCVCYIFFHLHSFFSLSFQISTWKSNTFRTYIYCRDQTRGMISFSVKIKLVASFFLLFFVLIYIIELKFFDNKTESESTDKVRAVPESNKVKCHFQYSSGCHTKNQYWEIDITQN